MNQETFFFSRHQASAILKRKRENFLQKHAAISGNKDQIWRKRCMIDLSSSCRKMRLFFRAAATCSNQSGHEYCLETIWGSWYCFSLWQFNDTKRRLYSYFWQTLISSRGKFHGTRNETKKLISLLKRKTHAHTQYILWKKKQISSFNPTYFSTEILIMTSFLIRRKRCRFFAAVLVIKMDIKCRNETARTYEKKIKNTRKYEKLTAMFS